MKTDLLIEFIRVTSPVIEILVIKLIENNKFRWLICLWLVRRRIFYTKLFNIEIREKWSSRFNKNNSGADETTDDEYSYKESNYSNLFIEESILE